MATPTKKQLMNPNIMDSKKFTDQEIMDGLIKFKMIDPKDFYSKKKSKDTGKRVVRRTTPMKDSTKKIRKPESKYAANKGGMMKKKTKYMAKGGIKKTKYRAKGGMKKTKGYARGGAARRK